MANCGSSLASHLACVTAFNHAFCNIISDLPGVVIYLVDVVIGGQDLDEHNHNLQTFLNCASEVNLQLSKENVPSEE